MVNLLRTDSDTHGVPLKLFLIATGRLSLKVVPESSRDEIVAWLGDVLKVRVKATPENGRAIDRMDDEVIRAAFPRKKLGKSGSIGTRE